MTNEEKMNCLLIGFAFDKDVSLKCLESSNLKNTKNIKMIEKANKDMNDAFLQYSRQNRLP